MDIKIFGHVCMDRNISENSFYTAAGSPAMFINRIYKQFPDCSVEIIAPYGPDFVPYLLDTNIYPRYPNSKSTLVYENITKSGKRIQKAFNREEAVPVPINEETQFAVSMADIIFFAPLLSNYQAEYLKGVYSCAKKESLKVLLPQGYFRNFTLENHVITRPFGEAKEILTLVDMAIVSEQDYPDMINTAQEWIRINNCLVVVVTLGERGAVAITQNGRIHLPTTPVPEKDVVDSVGSGDIFSAAFALRYRQTKDLQESGRFANELARQCLFFTSDNIKIDLKDT